MTTKPGFVGEVAGTFITRVLALLLGLVASVVLARALGAGGRGAVTAALLYPTLLLTFFEGGFRQATIHALGQGIAREREVVGAVLAHFVLASGLSALATVGLLSVGSGQAWSTWQILAAAAYVPAGLASALVRGLLLGRQEIVIANLVLRRGKYAFTALLLLLWAVGALNITTALVISSLGQLAGVGVGLRKLRSLGVESPTWSLTVWWQLAQRGATYAAALFAITSNYRIGMIVMERAQLLGDLGEYTVAAQLAEVLWQLPTAFGFVLFAHAAAAQGEAARVLEQNVARSTRISILLVGIGAVALAVVAPWVIPVVFGAEFVRAPAMMLGLLPGVIAFTTFKVINNYFAGIGSPRTALLLMVPTLLVNYALASAFVESLGGIGIAYAASISYVVAAVAFVWAFQRRSGIAWIDVVIPKRTDIANLVKAVNKRR